MDLALPIALSFVAGGAARGLLDRWREHRTGPGREPQAVSDLLLWAFLVGPHTILQKDGSWLTAFRYRGPDRASATPEELDALARQFNDALLPYTDRWMFHLDAIRRPAVGYPGPGAFSDPLLRLIDEERRQAHESAPGTGVLGSSHFETEQFLAVTYAPPKEISARLESLFVSGREREIDWSSLFAGYERQVADLERRLGGVLDLERLSSDGLLTYLHECLTGEAHQVATPPSGADLDWLLSDRDLVGGWRPTIGERAFRAVAVHGFPHASTAGMLDLLNGLGLAFRASERILPLSRRAGEKAIRRAQMGWFRSRKGLASWLGEIVGRGQRKSERAEQVDALFEDADASGMVEDAARAAAENASDQVRFAASTLTLLAFDSDPKGADRTAGELAKALADHGFDARVEGLNTLEAWLGSLPGQGHPNLRRPLLSTANLADLAPLTSVWPGLAHNPSPYFPPESPALLVAATSGSTPFRLHLHDSDVGHTLIVGRTGGGKSTLVGLLCAQFQRYAGAQVFLFDIGGSGALLAWAAGGKHYDLAAGAGLSFQPLAGIDEANERAWAGAWIEDLLALQGASILPPDRAAIDRALGLVAGNAPGHRTLTELSVQLQSRELKEALRPYTLDGPFGSLLDADRDDLEDGGYQVFELRALMDLDEKILLPVLTYLFHRVEQRLNGRPTLLVIEEAWLPLLHSQFAGRIQQWLLTLRKQNVAVVLVTQSLAQLEESPQRQTIFESCPTRILLPNPDAANPRTAALYAELGLSGVAIERLARARAKRDYFFVSPRGRRMFELGLGPVALAFLSSLEGKSAPETLRVAREVRDRHGESWPAAWLRDRGLEAEAAQYEALFVSQGDLP